jgi:hypothetical protein
MVVRAHIIAPILLQQLAMANASLVEYVSFKLLLLPYTPLLACSRS